MDRTNRISATQSIVFDFGPWGGTADVSAIEGRWGVSMGRASSWEVDWDGNIIGSIIIG